jgi:hypothetical protein
VCHVPHSSDEIVVVGRLPVSTEGYGPLVQRHIIVVRKRENLGEPIEQPSVDIEQYRKMEIFS